jgi:hypothetical protein
LYRPPPDRLAVSLAGSYLLYLPTPESATEGHQVAGPCHFT